MANVSNPLGFVPVGNVNGNMTLRRTEYSIASAYSTALSQGDPVKSTGTSDNIAAAAAGDTMIGIFDSVEYTDAAGNKIRSNYWPASQVAADAVAYVFDDPDTIFEAEVNGVGLAANDQNSMTDHVVGTPTTLHSTAVLDASAIAGSGKVGFKILKLVSLPNNNFGVAAKATVLINEHELRTMTAV